MACRVGMSTDPERRIQYWKREEGHTDSAILKKDLTYREATETEKSYARSLKCRYSRGGLPKRGRVWSIYHVWGGQ